MSQEILKVGISRLCPHKSLFTSFFTCCQNRKIRPMHSEQNKHSMIRKIFGVKFKFCGDSLEL
jgi:hypothetical protein